MPRLKYDMGGAVAPGCFQLKAGEQLVPEPGWTVIALSTKEDHEDEQAVEVDASIELNND